MPLFLLKKPSSRGKGCGLSFRACGAVTCNQANRTITRKLVDTPATVPQREAQGCQEKEPQVLCEVEEVPATSTHAL